MKLKTSSTVIFRADMIFNLANRETKVSKSAFK